MWLFGKLTEGKPSPKPVERAISIRRSGDGDDEDGQDFQGYGERSGSLNNTGYGQTRRNYSLSHAVEEARRNARFVMEDERDDDDSVDTTSSSVSGSVGGEGVNGRGSRASGYSREPLDPRIWSSVTSPGFMSRIVHQANGGTSPLNDFRKTTGKSPFSRSPHGHLKIGQLPISTVPRRPTSSLLSFPSPKGRSMYSYGRYTKLTRQDSNHTVFVKVAPVDLNGSAPSVIPLTPSPSSSPSKGGSLSLSSYNESATQGLGGVPQVALSRRFSRLWPNSAVKRNEGVVLGNPRTGYQLSTSPVNDSVIEALASRKRSRDAAKYTDNQTFRQPMSAPLTPDDIANKHSKRVKFISEQDLNRPLAFDQYTDLGSGGSEPLTSKSILEQMNQTEKRFLPDSIPSPLPKRTKIMSSPPSPIASSSSAMAQPYRKRRSDNGIGVVELDDECFEDPKSKTGKFCHCNECYLESAGGVQGSPQHTPMKSHNASSILSPPGSARKKVTFLDSSTSEDMNFKKSYCDKGISTDSGMDIAPSKFIRKVTETSTVMTKENYIYDQGRRMERFRRALGLAEPDKSSITNLSASQPPASVSKVESTQSTFGSHTPTTSTQNTVPNSQSSISNSESSKPFSFGSTAPTVSLGNESTQSTFGSSTPTTSAPVPIVVSNTQSLITNSESSKPFSFGSTAPAVSSGNENTQASSAPGSQDKVDGPPFSFGSGTGVAPTTVKSEHNSSEIQQTPVKVENSSEITPKFSFTTVTQAAPVLATSTSFSQPAPDPPKPFTFGSATTTQPSPFGNSVSEIKKVEAAPGAEGLFQLGQNSSATQSSAGFSFTPQAASPASSKFGFPSTTQAAPVLATSTSFSQPPSSSSDPPKPFTFGSATTTQPSPFGNSVSEISKVEAAPGAGGVFQIGQNPSATQSSAGVFDFAPQAASPAPSKFGLTSTTQAAPVLATSTSFSQPASSGFDPPKPFAFGSATTTQTPAFGNSVSEISKGDAAAGNGGMFQFGRNPSATQSSAVGGFSFPPQAASPAPSKFGFPSTTQAAPVLATSTSFSQPASDPPKPFTFGSATTTQPSTFGNSASEINKVETAPGAGGLFQFGQNSSATQSSGGGFNFGQQVASPSPFNSQTNTSTSSIFGQSSVPQTSSGGFSFTPQPVSPFNPPANPPAGPMFGQTSTPQSTGGGFNFAAQSASSFNPPANPSAGTLFGQTNAPQGAAGGFSFPPQGASPFNAPASPAANSMFSLGSKTSTPRSGRSRRYR